MYALTSRSHTSEHVRIPSPTVYPAPVKRWIAVKNLIVDAVEHTTCMVEETQTSATNRVYDTIEWALPPTQVPLRESVSVIRQVHGLVSQTTFASIRAVNHLVDHAIDLAAAVAGNRVDAPAPDLAPTLHRSDAVGSRPWLRDAATGLLNGVVGNYLATQNNALDLGMRLLFDGAYLPTDGSQLQAALATATPKLCIFIHGLATTDWSWSIDAEKNHGDAGTNYGTLMRDELGYTPIYLRYNSGQHISQNGRRLADLLETLARHWPGAPPQIVLIGHSMGGLVARSAAYYANEAKLDWVENLTHVFCLGSPHLGAPLEKAGHLLTRALRWLDTPGTQIPGRILDARSDGIKDLRYGDIVDEDWQTQTRGSQRRNRSAIPFVKHAGYYYVASTVSSDPRHPLGHVLGDWLVRLPSASGSHPEPSRRVPFHTDCGAVFGGISHLQLANHPHVYASIKRWCEV